MSASGPMRCTLGWRRPRRRSPSYGRASPWQSADAQAALEAAEALRQAEAERKARGLVARLRAAWRGE